MSSLTRIVFESRASTAEIAAFIKPNAFAAKQSIARLANYIRGIAGGVRNGTLTINTGTVKATASITITGDIVAAETFTLCGRTFTARASGATTNEFNIVTSDVTSTAANVAAAILASNDANVTGSVTATSALGVVTITALVPGTIGNGLRLSESLTNATRVDFAGGSDGTQTALVAGASS